MNFAKTSTPEQAAHANRINRVKQFTNNLSDFQEISIMDYFKIKGFVNHINIIDDGIIDGGDDGGIDAAYVVCDDEIVSEISDLTELYKPNEKIKSLDLYLFQTKEGKSFSENTIKLVANTIQNHIVNMESELLHLNPKLVEKIQLFRSAIKKMAPHPKNTSIHFVYIALGYKDKAHPKVILELERCKDIIEESSLIPSKANNSSSRLWDVKDIIAANDRVADYNVSFKYESVLDIAKPRGAVVYTVKLSEYYKSILDKNNEGAINQNLFDKNVRAHLKKTDVNKKIEKTLKNTMQSDFCCYNNGVTVICDKISNGNKQADIINMQIVNGLQTTYAIFDSFKDMPEENKDSLLLVKAIPLQQNEFTEISKVIISTNQQNPISPGIENLQEYVHYDIEAKLRSVGIFYERRPAFYRNQGKSKKSIISPRELSQAYNAIILSSPDSSRGAPAKLLKETKHKAIFLENVKDDIYINMAYLHLELDRKLFPVLSYWKGKQKGDFKNLKFHIYLVHCKMNNLDFSCTHSKFVELFKASIGSEPNYCNLCKSIDLTLDYANTYITKTGQENKVDTILGIAKDKKFTDALLKSFNL